MSENQAPQPQHRGYLTETDSGDMLWRLEDLEEARTYCPEGEEPQRLYLAAPQPPQAAQVDVEQMLRECVPGGSICDPQQIADHIRAYFAAPQPQQAAPAGQFWVDYDNDTGPGDDGFWEWWTVIDEQAGDAVCKCDEKATAERIASLLNAATPPQGAPAPQRKALTDEQKSAMWQEVRYCLFGSDREAYMQGFEDAERAHNIPQPDCEQEKTR